MSKQKFLDKLERFLAESRKSHRGGFAEVTKKDINDLYSLLSDLLALKFEKDADGDPPINFIVIDRTKYEPMHYAPLQYTHKDDYNPELALRMAMMNLNMASESLRRHFEIQQMRKERGE